jgi:flavin reductase (DIM6/NTAB) family NADH-FMN oxidoreductase RutF
VRAVGVDAIFPEDRDRNLVSKGSEMEFDFTTLKASDRYKLLVSLVLPRPIALVTTLSPGGVVNAAPFSFFNVLGDDPPIVIVSVDRKLDGNLKDTGRNIIANKEFIVHLVDEAIAEKMHGCAVEAEENVSEVDLVGFTQSPAKTMRPPRIAEAPVAMECVLHSNIETGNRNLFIGEVKWMHVREGIIDPQTLRRVPGMFHPVGRLYANKYCKLGEEFEYDNNQYIQVMQQMGRV